MTKIDQKIVNYSIVKEPASVAGMDFMHERLDRPEVLIGKTYKIKPPDSNALYITITDILLNGGTEYEQRRPFEIFINSKAMEHFQWVVALTRVISAVFRKGGEISFLVEELKSIFDPKGGYFQKGRYVPSIVAAIGHVIERHLIELGCIEQDDSLAEAAKLMIEEKMQKRTDAESKMLICPKCSQKSAIMMDGCLTCTNQDCLHSKCG